MVYYRCRCGAAEAWGNMPPYPCQGCEKCGTTLEPNPSLHKKPEPHNYAVSYAECDNGTHPVTRCMWCGDRKPTSQ